MNDTPHRAQGAWAMIGGLLMVVSYFLPSSLTNGGANSQSSSPATVSAWSNIVPFFQSGTAFNYRTNSYGPIQPHVFVGLLIAMPLIMSVIIVILGVWALITRPGATRSALLGAAVTVVVFAMFTSLGNLYSSDLLSGATAFSQIPGASLVFLGLLTFQVGGFVSLVAAFLALQGGRKA